MSAEYILSRASRLREEMRASGANAYVALNDEDSNWESLFYLSGFRGTAGAIIIYDNAEPELILDGRYAEAGRAQSPYKVTEQKKSLAEDLRDSLRAHGAEEILCEARKTSHENWLRLADGLGRWRDGGAMMEKLRRKKDAEEISCIKKAAEIGARAFLEALDAVRPGMTEKEFESLLNYRISAAGGGAGFDMIVASGARGAMPHGRASDKPMQRGECVTVDFGARWNGYLCDITRNFSIGEPDGEAAAASRARQTRARRGSRGAQSRRLGRRDARSRGGRLRRRGRRRILYAQPRPQLRPRSPRSARSLAPAQLRARRRRRRDRGAGPLLRGLARHEARRRLPRHDGRSRTAHRRIGAGALRRFKIISACYNGRKGFGITEEAKKRRESRMKKYVCTVCGYVYDPEIGDPDSGIAAGTAFEDIPDGWVCPVCGVGKEMFEAQ